MFIDIKRKIYYENNQVYEPKILVLYGMSGTGKTLLKKFLTGEILVKEILDITNKYPKYIGNDINKEILVLSKIFSLNFNNFSNIITTTTRQLRPNERNGIDYYFVSKEEFKNKINKKKIFEYTNIYGNYYGSDKTIVKKTLTNNNAVVILDNLGVEIYKKEFKNRVISVYLNVDNKKVVKERLIKRNENNISDRINNIETVKENNLADYIINTNQHIDNILRDLLKILLKEFRMKRKKIYIEKKSDFDLVNVSNLYNIDNNFKYKNEKIL